MIPAPQPRNALVVTWQWASISRFPCAFSGLLLPCFAPKVFVWFYLSWLLWNHISLLSKFQQKNHWSISWLGSCCQEALPLVLKSQGWDWHQIKVKSLVLYTRWGFCTCLPALHCGSFQCLFFPLSLIPVAATPSAPLSCPGLPWSGHPQTSFYTYCHSQRPSTCTDAQFFPDL